MIELENYCNFNINNPFTGVIRNTEPLEYDKSHNHILSVVAYDCGMMQSAPVMVTIKVNKPCRAGWKGKSPMGQDIMNIDLYVYIYYCYFVAIKARNYKILRIYCYYSYCRRDVCGFDSRKIKKQQKNSRLQSQKKNR